MLTRFVLPNPPFSHSAGNSTKATSGINGAGTRTQQDQDVKDSVKAFFEDTKKSAKDLARDDLIQVLTGNSASAVHWLQDKFNLDLSVLGRLGGHSYQRCVSDTMGEEYYVIVCRLTSSFPMFTS